MIPRHQLGIRRHQPGATDAHGTRPDWWGPPVSWPVYWVAPGSMRERRETGADVSTVAFSVGAPADGPLPRVRDRVVMDGAEFEVDGELSDWTRGPWVPPGWFGVVVELRRA